MAPDTEGLHAIANTENTCLRADIVFVHGLGGASHSTWRYGKEGKPDHFFWPEELGKDLPDCGIWSLGHASGMSHWFSDEGMALEDLANNFALKLTNKGFGGRPIIFITHSMGGLVVKEFITAAFALGGDDWARVVKAVCGIVFLGTPHHGSHMATVAKGFAVLLRTQEHLKQMRFANKALDQLHKRFMKWQAETKCPVEAYVETRGIARSGWFGLKRLLPRVLVVPDISGDPNLPGCDCHRIGADHIALVKPAGREDDVYAGVLRFIRDALAEPVPANPKLAPPRQPPLAPANHPPVNPEIEVAVSGRNRVYISYSYDSNEHIQRVREFAARLKADGIEARIDTDVNCDPPEGWPSYSQNQIQDADYVILVCTQTYRRRFDGQEEPGIGKGVTFEGKLIRQEIFDSQGRTEKFIPVIFDFDDDRYIPLLLRDRGRYVLSRDAESTAALNYQSLLRRLRPSPSAAQSSPKIASPQKSGQDIMPTHQFNARRLQELEELLDIEYEKYHEFEKEIALSDGASRITLKQRFKRDVTSRLCKLEQEYAEILVAGVPTAQIQEAEADALVVELSQTVTILQTAPTNTPQEMMRLLEEIKSKLSEPEKAASAKLKVSLPLIPAICAYEMEIETAGLMRKFWRKGMDFFKGFLAGRPA